ncbi:hypothetical protein [Sphingomonas sp. OK281]|uniref:hypothetical protein n=1 Tax=Sphingomonas sp. OK281 TaxID=1881067 RepID=UPI001113FA48|nr:hypothetical protein [Sphingomonas sp. OK281]
MSLNIPPDSRSIARNAVAGFRPVNNQKLCGSSLFAVAKRCSQMQHGDAFQASSPKNYPGRLTLALFLSAERHPVRLTVAG